MTTSTRVEISASLQEKIDSLGDMAEEGVARSLYEVSQTLTSSSPVDTGAFVTSWSLSDKPLSRRSYSSHGKSPAVSQNSEKNRALGELIEDIKGLRNRWTFKKGVEVSAGTFYFVNGAPHAAQVNKNSAVIAKARRKHG